MKLALALALCLLAGLSSSQIRVQGITFNPLNAQNTRPGVTEQVCATPNNPYGMLAIKENQGTLKAGCMLISTWNDVNTNTAGRGNIIWQCCPGNPIPTVWANVTLKAGGPCSQDGGNVGLTQALSKVDDRIYQASLPQDNNNNFRAGCLLKLDTQGNVLNEAKNPAVNGPWGMTCTRGGDRRDTCFVSSVGSMSPSMGGRRLLQNTASKTGFIARFNFRIPEAGANWDLGTATILVQGINSQPTAAGFNGGTVAPGQPVLEGEKLFYPELLDNRVSVVENAFREPQTPRAVFAGTPLNGPNAVEMDPTRKTVVVTNTGDGNLVFLRLDREVRATPFNVDASNTAGNLFNAVFLGKELFFVADGTNTLDKVINLDTAMSAMTSEAKNAASGATASVGAAVSSPSAANSMSENGASMGMATSPAAAMG